MPYVRVTTSAPLPEASEQRRFLEAISRRVAEGLGKPESYVMTSLVGASMTFGGGHEPCAAVEISAIGSLSPDQTATVNAGICAELETSFALAPARTFVVFTSVPRELWGVRGAQLG